MELEQIIKQLDWLDDERRKDKTTIASLQEKLSNFEVNQPDLLHQISNLNADISRLSAISTRFENLESAMSQMKIDLSRRIDETEKKRADHEREVEKARLAELESINKSLGELRKKQGDLREIKKTLNDRVEEEFRLSRLMEELENKIAEYKYTNEDTKRTQKLLEDGRQTDTKRLMDMQNDVIALRKKAEENRSKLDVLSSSLQKSEARINELLSAEQGRKQEQAEFVEKANLIQLERNKEWKAWQARLEEFSNRATILDSQLQSLEVVSKNAQRAQNGFEEISGRLERRINEITEMNRLMEERSRNEWNNFKADDQKRWINNSLVVEEKIREISKKEERLEERVTFLEDRTLEIKDVLSQFMGNSNREFSKIINLLKEWFDETEGLTGRLG